MKNEPIKTVPMERTIRLRPWGGLVLRLVLAAITGISLAGCIQDGVVIPVALLKGKVIPVGIVPSTVTTGPGPGSVTVTINTTVPVVGVRLDTVGSGTNVSLIDPIGPKPASDEHTFALVTGDWTLPTKRLGHRRVVARGQFFDLGWGDFYPNEFNVEYQSINLKSVTIPALSPLRTDPKNMLLLKAPGRAVFCVFAEDFTIDRRAVKSVRLVFDAGTNHEVALANPSVGFNVPDDGSMDTQLDHAPDTVSGDLSAGDGVFTRVLTGLTPGEHQYAYVINNDDKFRRDPYEEKSDDLSGVRRSVIVVQ